MPDFNPITDLRPVDQDRSSEVSPEELDAIKISLMETAWRTKQIVDVLERNNTLLERDIEKITNLKRRLRRSIGIIPGMPGRAGALLGVGVGMGLIPPIGGWKNMPTIPPIGRPPKPPLIPEPDPIYVPVDVPQPIPVDVPQPVPGDITVPGDVPNPGGIINWPEIPLIPGLYPEGEDLGQGLGQDIFNPNALPTPSFAFSEGMNFNWDTFLETPSTTVDPKYDESWLRSLKPEQLFELVKVNAMKHKELIVLGGLTAAMILMPWDLVFGDFVASGALISRLLFLLGAGSLTIPAGLVNAAPVTNNSNLNNSNFNINNSIGDFSTSSSDIASLQLNTRKTDTFVIITDQPIA